MEPNQIEQKSNGALIGSVIIIVILIIGGIYFWKASVERTSDSAEFSSESLDTSSMEADLNSLDMENLDSDI